MTRGARMVRLAGWCLVAIALLLPLAACVWTSGSYLPYQDPTPALAQKYADEVAQADREMAVSLTVSGVLLCVGGAAIVGATRAGRRLSRMD